MERRESMGFPPVNQSSLAGKATLPRKSFTLPLSPGRGERQDDRLIQQGFYHVSGWR